MGELCLGVEAERRCGGWGDRGMGDRAGTFRIEIDNECDMEEQARRIRKSQVEE